MPPAGPPASWHTPARHPGARDLAKWRTARLTAGECVTAGNHTDAVVLRYTCDVPAMYLARQPEPATCAAAGRHRCPRPSEVPAGYICGQSPGGDFSRGPVARTRSPSARRAV